MAMPSVDEEREQDPMRIPEPEEDMAMSRFLDPPERPISAPPVYNPLGGSSLFNFHAATSQSDKLDMLHSWSGTPDRPASAPPLDKDQAGGDEVLGEESASTSRLGAIGSDRGQKKVNAWSKRRRLIFFPGVNSFNIATAHDTPTCPTRT
jgi:hypothetical protein